MKFLFAAIACLMLVGCISGNPRISINIYKQPVTAELPNGLMVGETPTTDQTTMGTSSGGGVTVVIKQQVVETAIPVGVSIPAAALGGL